MSEHRIKLMQRGDDLFDLCDCFALRIRQSADILLFGRQELMQRRVKEADVDRISFHRRKERFKVSLLIREDLI